MISQRVELGDNNSYVVKGIVKASIELELGNNIHLNNVLYVPGLKKNFVSISCLEDKGDRITFVDGKVKMLKHLFMMKLILVNYGIKGMLTFIIKHCHL
jgi:hypothetical protein